ncbi:MAG: hypothetical protein PQJ60_12255 [Spirochaetales bacterium]|nr:hypothetical protein [Spirochaetales bacterium]
MRKYTILISLSLIMFFTACSGEGLFYTIETEELVEDSNMENIKFSDVVVTTSYYVAKGKYLWYREIDDSSWSMIDSSLDSISSVVLYNSVLYYAGRDGDNGYVYELDIDTDGPSEGTQVCEIEPDSGDYTWLQLFSNGSRMFLNRVDYEYDDDDDPYVTLSELYYTADTATADIETAFTTSSTTTPLLIVDDEDGDYWPLQSEGMAFGSSGETWILFNDVDEDEDLEEGGLLYYDASGNFTTSTDLDDYTELSDYMDDHYYNSIYFADTDYSDWLLISTRSDWSATDTSLFYVYDSDGDTDWTDETWNENDEDDDCDNLYSSFVYNSEVSDYVIACTVSDYYIDADGYVLIDVTDTDSLSIDSDEDDMADEDNYESSDLEDSSVYSMVFDTNATDYAIVAATSTGVWTFDSDSLEWSQE